MKRIALFLVCVLFCIPAFGQKVDTKVIDQINASNAKVKSFTADVETVIKRRMVVYTLSGKLSCEKDKNLRITNHMVVNGKFMSDMGSNGSYFWFYARRVDPNNMFYAKYADLNKTNLKDSLNPLWLIESLNMIQVDTKNTTVQMQGDKLVVFQVKTSTRKKQMIKAIVIDPKQPTVVANYLYNANKKLVTSADIESFYTTNNGLLIPKVIKGRWNDEDVYITWTFRNFKFNVKIDSNVFKMPNLGVNEVDLGNTKEQYQGIND